jgi:signal transduction histidine kinase/DNA-binding response OmpR family regulator
MRFEQLLNPTHLHGTDLLLDSRGLVWLGTMDGLILWDSKHKIVRRLFMENGLVNNSIKAISEDLDKTLWVSTSGGISRITVTEGPDAWEFQMANFNRFDGVIENEFNEKCIYTTPQGLLFLGGINGFNSTDLRKPWELQQLQKPLFTSFRLFGTPLKPGVPFRGKPILKHVVSATDTIRLHYNQNFFSLGFSALNYVNPSQTYFRYKLEGIDTEWREIAAENGTGMATYTNLAPGTYRFYVKSANNSKKWSSKAACMTIVIRPPFWKTTLAYVLYLIVFVYALYWGLALYRRRTHQKLELQNVERLNQLKFNFFTNVSHEFRTPLTLILTPLESILKEVKGSALEVKLQPIYRNAMELLNLVNQLLDFRRLEVKGEKLNLTFGDFNDFVQQTKEAFDELAKTNRIDFSLETQDGNYLMYYDGNKIQKVLNNLLSNGFKYTPTGGSVKMLLRKMGDSVELQVSDNGKGISKEDLPHIFDRFYQASDAKGGSGIGLHLVREYVHLHQGQLLAESVPSQGTVFKITLPTGLSPLQEMSSEQQTSMETEQPEHLVLKEYKVLVVEDNDELRRFLVGELRAYYTVLQAEDGQVGLRLARNDMPDLIISDVMMPNMNGMELCQTIKSEVETSHIPVILLTALSSEGHRVAGYEAGADEYLSKPFNMDILLLRIAKLIEHRTLRQKHFSEKIEVNPSEITITSLDEELIQKSLELIEKNLANGHYSVQQLSNDLNMDRTVLYRKLLHITGLAPIEYMRSIRLKRAAQLLVHGGYPVAEVAEMTGFNTQKYFTNYFKEAFGCTPSKYAELTNSGKLVRP